MTFQHEKRRSRRLTPPISALAAFEAVVRRQSFTAAAEELALTQSAVSRQVSALEEMLGTMLLDQNRRRQITLTPAGRYYSDHVRRILADLTAATAEAIALSGGGRVLRLGIPPAFGSLWLIPRMPSFFAAHPDVSIEFSTRMPAHPRVNPGSLHALIDFSPSPGKEGEWRELLQLQLRPVATPRIADAVRRLDREELANVHLLIHTSERFRWNDRAEDIWLDLLRAQPILTFENYTMLLQAALNGIGIALAPIELIEGDLAASRLVPLADWSIVSQSTGYLIYDREMSEYAPLVAFSAWLLDAVRNRPTSINGRD